MVATFNLSDNFLLCNAEVIDRRGYAGRKFVCCVVSLRHWSAWHLLVCLTGLSTLDDWSTDRASHVSATTMSLEHDRLSPPPLFLAYNLSLVVHKKGLRATYPAAGTCAPTIVRTDHHTWHPVTRETP